MPTDTQIGERGVLPIHPTSGLRGRSEERRTILLGDAPQSKRSCSPEEAVWSG